MAAAAKKHSPRLSLSKSRKSSPTPAENLPAQAEEIAFRRTARDSGLAQQNYQATTLDVNRIQAALRADCRYVPGVGHPARR